jgi:arylsulfatase A-like enzyme
MTVVGRAALVLALLLALGCAAEPPAEELLSALPHAEVRRADSELLFAERLTRQGWGLAERDSEGAFRWAVGGEAEIEFYSLAAGAAKLTTRARGAVGPGFSRQPVTVLLNDLEVADLALAAEWAEFEIALEQAQLQRGMNRLTLRFARPLAPAATDRDTRPLAGCFRTLRISLSPGSEADKRSLSVELGAAVGAERLGDGWSDPIQAGPEGEEARWALAPAARLRLDLRAPADRRLVLTARRPEAMTSQRLEAWLNGHQLTDHELAAEWSKVEMEAPREEWLPGSNELMLRFGASHDVAGERRGALVARLAVDTLAEPALVLGQDPAGPFVRQPAGTSVDLFRRLPDRSARLVLAAAGRGGEAAQVALDIEPDGGELTEAWQGELADDGAQAIELSAWAGALVRLRLSVAGGRGLTWRRLELQGEQAEGVTVSTAGQEPAPAMASARPNLLLYVIDTLRADHTSLYGYDRPTTPRLEELADEGIVFDPAYANASWTRPGTATLLTGTLPSVNGAVNTLSLLSSEVEMLSESLQAAGYATHALVTNPNLRPQWGINRGWDEYRYIELALEFSDSSAIINREVIPRLAGWAAAERPFFLYLHSMDPHAPYQPSAEYRRFLRPGYDGPVDGSMASVTGLLDVIRRDGAEAHRADLEQLQGLYDGAIQHNDARIGELVDALAAEGLLDSTAILVTSDHGEEFFEHGGVTHGHSLYEEQIRIPMLLRPPGGVAARRVAGAQQVDVAVMLSALAGVEPPRMAMGRDLTSTGDAAERPVFAEEELRDRRLWSFIDGGMKLHYNRNARHAEWQRQETRELFDLGADAGEEHNLYTSRPVVAGYLLERARALAARLPAGAERDMISSEELSEQLREQMRALGYLQ